MPPSSPEAPGFWSFAETFYNEPGVREHCLWLQDHAGVDVVVLLFCLWAGKYRGGLTQDHVKQLLARAERWSTNLVRPLRATRRWLKTEEAGAGALYEQIKEVELTAEKQLIEQLEATLNLAATDRTPGRAAASHNLDTYLALTGIRLSAEGQRSTLALLEGAMAYRT